MTDATPTTHFITPFEMAERARIESAEAAAAKLNSCFQGNKSSRPCAIILLITVNIQTRYLSENEKLSWRELLYTSLRVSRRFHKHSKGKKSGEPRFKFSANRHRIITRNSVGIYLHNNTFTLFSDLSTSFRIMVFFQNRWMFSDFKKWQQTRQQQH